MFCINILNLQGRLSHDTCSEIKSAVFVSEVLMAKRKAMSKSRKCKYSTKVKAPQNCTLA